jgi:hypothetical protein
LAYRLTAAVGFLSLTEALQVSAIGGIGAMTIRSDSHSISAGGFGTITIPGRSEHFTTYSLGMSVSSSLGRRVSVHVSPELLFVSPANVSSMGYSIGGGLSIGIL